METSVAESLAQKLGFKAGDSIFVETTPGWYTEFADGIDLELEPSLPTTHAHIFCRNKGELLNFLQDYNLSQVERSLWVSWFQKESGERSDLTDTVIRDTILPLGWVDTKVVSIDKQWSGLKFVRRAKT